MAVIFSPDRVGSSIGIPITGAVPASRIKFSVNYNMDRWSLSGLAKGVANNISHATDVAAAYYTSKEGRELINKLKYLGGGAGIAAGDLTNALLDWKYGAGDSGIDKAPNYSGSSQESKYSGGFTNFWTQRAQMDLNDIIAPLGLITGVTLAYKETATLEGKLVESASAMQMGTAAIGGVVFDTYCDASGPKNTRHGLEPILEYYYHHRVSNESKPLTETVIQFGQTVLKGWVIGMEAEPQNMDFRIWKWSINLALSPDYKPKPDTAPKTGVPGSLSKENYEGYDAQGFARRFGNVVSMANINR